MNRDVEYYKEQICMKVNELQDVDKKSNICSKICPTRTWRKVVKKDEIKL